MDLVNENLIIDSIDNQKLSYEQVSSVLKETFPSVRGLSSQSVRWFYSERSISSRVSTEKVTERVMEASSKIISAFSIMMYMKEFIHVDLCTIILRFCHPIYSIMTPYHILSPLYYPSMATQGVLSKIP